MKTTAGALRATLQPLELRGLDDVEPAFAAMKAERASALIVLRNPLTTTHRARIVDLAATSRLPATYGDREFVDALLAVGACAILLRRNDDPRAPTPDARPAGRPAAPRRVGRGDRQAAQGQATRKRE